MRKRGITFVEILVASAITFLVLAVLFTIWNFAEKTWRAERSKANALKQLEIGMEMIKRDLMASDSNKIFYYPPAATSFSAVSLPVAIDSDSDGGFIELDDDENIIWDKTIIYHVYDNSGVKELRRTVFDPRDNTLTAADRQDQLNDVVANGEPQSSSTPNYTEWSSSQTRPICKSDDIQLTFKPRDRTFDGYSASVGRSENISFGSLPLAAGEHYITFEVVDKNSANTDPNGYRLGIDCFSISPSGSRREGEETDQPTTDPDSGDSKLNEDMINNGVWSGNRHLEYQADDIGDFISLKFYNDEWIETNFDDCLPSEALIEYGNRTGDGGETSGDDNIVLRLDGFGDAWSALAQTGALGKAGFPITDSGTDGIVFRNVLKAGSINVDGRAVQIAFDNMSPAGITIDYANIMEEIDGPNGDPATVEQIFFYDEGGSNSIFIGAGESKNSDWIDINNFDQSKDYLITFHIPTGSYTISGWEGLPASEHSYLLYGDAGTAAAADWSSYTCDTRDIIYTVESCDASYFSSGVVVSEIYDTELADPDYETLAWNIAKDNYGNFLIDDLGANLVITVRADDDESVLQGSTDWTTGTATIDTESAENGSVSLGTTFDGERYIQFRGEFESKPTNGKSDYTKSCVLKDLSIRWRGEKVLGGSTLVNINGYFTTRPNYGIFTVKVDGYSLTKGMEAGLTISEDFYDRTISRSITAEIEPRNTGK